MDDNIQLFIILIGLILIGIVYYLIRSHGSQSLIDSLLYFLYSTPLGRWRHSKAISRLPPRPHTSPECVFRSELTEVYAVPFLADNYAYLVVDRATSHAALVDPAHPAAVRSALSGLSWPAPPQLKLVICTHWHHDHSGGNFAPPSAFLEPLQHPTSPLEVVGSSYERTPHVTRQLRSGEEVLIGEGTRLRAVHTPGHTRGHCCFVLEGDAEASAVFSGDFLFVGGMGKLFECSPHVAAQSLLALSEAMSPSTLLLPGHEYAMKNLAFVCAYLLPGDRAAQEALERVRSRRAQRSHAIAVPWAQEATYNPYLRVREPQFRAALIEKWGLDPNSSMGDLIGFIREKKNWFDHQSQK